MKTTSYEKLPAYEVSGVELTIYWNEEENAPREDETEAGLTEGYSGDQGQETR